jgi:hypothetical protein
MRPISVAAPLEFKKRVRMREDAPVEVPVRRLPPLVFPVATYWLFSGVIICGIASGAFPLRRWVESIEQPAPESAYLDEPPAPEPAPASEPRFLPSQPATNPDPSPGPALAATASEPQPMAAPPTEAPTPTEPIALLPPPDPAPTRTSRAPLNFSGSTGSTALTWRPQRDPLEALTLPWESQEPESEPDHRLTDEQPRVSAKASRRKPEPADQEPSEPPQRHVPAPAVAAGSSCEAAVMAYNEEMDLRGGKRAADLPREAFAAVLDRGTYLASCGVPDTMSVDICAAVQRGRAVGVTVVTRPGNGRIQACVAHAVRALRFPSHPKLDVARTRFE